MRTKATIKQVNSLTKTIMQIFIEPESYIPYLAGQYLQILYNDQLLSFSIANAPSNYYELHIRNNSNTYDLLKTGSVLDIQLPYGICHFENIHKNLPIVFIAAGTGFAPIKAMIEAIGCEKKIAYELFWTARNINDIYMEYFVTSLQQKVACFKKLSLVSSTQGLFTSLDKNHSDDAQAWQYVINGPFDFVYRTRDHLVTNYKINATNIFSDAFYFEDKL